MSELQERKLAHLALCAHEDVESRRSTLLEEVHLLHEALPDLSLGEIDLSVEMLGRRLRAPILISGMTGGAPRAGEINRALATVAQKYGFAMGLGSQRTLLGNPEAVDTYQVRDVAPDVLLLGNVGAVQAREVDPERVAELVHSVHADALCVHLNAAQELVQQEGDRDFRGCLEAIAELVQSLPVPVVVKETGCGFAPATLARLREAGVSWVDVSGAGGTSWTRVESLRGTGRQREIGDLLRDWGIPTAVALVWARRAGLHTIASGGIRDAVDVVRALALGARVVGLALPFLRAHESAGLPGLIALAERLSEGLRALFLLVGARTTDEVARAPRVLGGGLSAWIGAETAAPYGRLAPGETR
jgi:isopentenyl-diphosphate delta-isomerase